MRLSTDAFANMLASMSDRESKSVRSRSRVGFYGCRSALVRIEFSDRASEPKSHLAFPRALWVDQCPGCGMAHGVGVFWRKIVSRDEGIEADILLDSMQRPTAHTGGPHY